MSGETRKPLVRVICDKCDGHGRLSIYPATPAAPLPPEPGMTEERFAEIVRDYEEQEPGFYKRNREWRMAVMQELIAEVRRLRSSTGADERLREAITRVEAEMFTAGEYEWAAKLRASLSVVPATGETSDGERQGEGSTKKNQQQAPGLSRDATPPCPCCKGTGMARPRDTRPDVDLGSGR